MSSPPRFDPRIFIGPPFTPCPACQAAEYGTLIISKFTVTRRCRACWYTATQRVPALHKKLVYLDQMVYSNMAKTLDPVWAADRRPQELFWSRVFDALERVFKLQLLVCPESTVHEKESALAEQPMMIRALYEHFAGGVAFEHPVMIHQHQLCVGLRAVLSGQAPAYDIHRGLFLHGDPDEWTERIRIGVNVAGLEPDPQVQRGVKDRSYAAMRQWFERWRTEEDKGFEDWYRLERQGHANNYVYLFEEHLKLMDQVTHGAVAFTEDVWNPRLEAEVVPALLRVAEEAGHTGTDRLPTVLGFLQSDVGCDAPANDLSALLMASLARKAANGQLRPPSPGMWNDITAISSFLPYCDAMFLDNECAGLLREEPLKGKIAAFGTRIFSSKTGEDFLEYLAALERQAGPDHVRLVGEVYGGDWCVPYREVLVNERARMARGRT